MPRLNRDRIRLWLEEHNWSVQHLAQECSALGDDTIPEGTMRNAVNGIDPLRPSRIRLICQVTAKQGDGIPYGQLVVDNHDDEQEPLARLDIILQRLTAVDQLLPAAVEQQKNNKELTDEVLRDLGHELVSVAGEITKLGVDLVRRANTQGRPVNFTDEKP